MAFSEDTINVNGKQVHYWEASPQFEATLILLHSGLGNAHLNWSQAIDGLDDSYHIIAPNLPGFGQSDSINITIQSLVDWTQGLMTALELEQAVLIGHSFGGLIARIFASQKPQLVPALVLVNGGVIPAIPAVAKLLARLPIMGNMLYNQIAKSTTGLSNLQSAIKTESVLTDEFRDAIRENAPPLSKLMRALSISPVPAERVPILPTLLLWGEEDTVTPKVVGERIRDNIPGAKLSLIADVGHMPQVEVPDIFAWQVKQFLSELTRPRRP